MRIFAASFLADFIIMLGSIVLYAMLGPGKKDWFGWSTVANASLHAVLLASIYGFVRGSMGEAVFFTNGPIVEAVSMSVLLGTGYLFGWFMKDLFTDEPEWVPDDDA